MWFCDIPAPEPPPRLACRLADSHAGVPAATVPAPDEAEDVAELGLAEVPGAAGAPAPPLAGELGDPALRVAEAGAEAPDDVDNAEHPAVSTPAASSGTASNLLFTESPVIDRRLINVSMTAWHPPGLDSVSRARAAGRSPNLLTGPWAALG